MAAFYTCYVLQDTRVARRVSSVPVETVRFNAAVYTDARNAACRALYAENEARWQYDALFSIGVWHARKLLIQPRCYFGGENATCNTQRIKRPCSCSLMYKIVMLDLKIQARSSRPRDLRLFGCNSRTLVGKLVFRETRFTVAAKSIWTPLYLLRTIDRVQIYQVSYRLVVLFKYRSKNLMKMKHGSW